jgi:serine/threonine-protein kinase HipA
MIILETTRSSRRSGTGGSRPRTISPHRSEHRDLALDCHDQGRYANAKNILSQHARFLLTDEEAQKIVADMKAQVQATWYETLRASGVSAKDAEAIRGAFVYPGFSL